MSDKLKNHGLSLEETMKVLNEEGLLADGVFGDVDQVTIFEPGKEPQVVKVKPVVVFETGKTPVTLLNPLS